MITIYLSQLNQFQFVLVILFIEFLMNYYKCMLIINDDF